VAKRIGPVKIKQYSIEFKLRAVQLSNQPGVLVKMWPSLCAFILSCCRSGESRSGTARLPRAGQLGATPSLRLRRQWSLRTGVRIKSFWRKLRAASLRALRLPASISWGVRSRAGPRVARYRCSSRGAMSSVWQRANRSTRTSR
jgi:transposase-like protein